MFQFYHEPKPIKTLLPIISLCRMSFFLFHPLGMQPFGESWHLYTGIVSPVCLRCRAGGSLLSSQQVDIKPRLLSHKDWPVTPGKTLAIVFLILWIDAFSLFLPSGIPLLPPQGECVPPSPPHIALGTETKTLLNTIFLSKHLRPPAVPKEVQNWVYRLYVVWRHHFPRLCWRLFLDGVIGEVKELIYWNTFYPAFLGTFST